MEDKSEPNGHRLRKADLSNTLHNQITSFAPSLCFVEEQILYSLESYCRDAYLYNAIWGTMSGNSAERRSGIAKRNIADARESKANFRGRQHAKTSPRGFPTSSNSIATSPGLVSWGRIFTPTCRVQKKWLQGR